MNATVVGLDVLAAAGVFAIAAITVGREARRLDSVAPRVVYDLDDAVLEVADRLPAATQARLTHDDVRELLRLHLGRMHRLGLLPADITDRRQDIEVPTFLEEVDEVAFVIGGAEQVGLEVADEDVAAVVDAHLAHLDAIGAVGPRALDTDPAT